MSDATYATSPTPQRAWHRFGRTQVDQPPHSAPGGPARGGSPSRTQSSGYAKVVAGAVVAVVVVVSLITWASGRNLKDQGKYTVATPSAVNGYTSIDTAATDALRSRWARTFSGRFLLKSGQRPKVGFYRQGASATPSFGVIAFDRTNSKYPGYNPEAALRKLLKDAKVASRTTERTGPLGGLLQCGTAAGSTSPVCGWADGSSLAGIVFLEPSSVDDAAATTLALRNAIEH
jgi:hypothetical protein